MQARLKCDDRFVTNPQIIFHAIDWIERNAVASSGYLVKKKIILKWNQCRWISESQQSKKDDI